MKEPILIIVRNLWSLLCKWYHILFGFLTKNENNSLVIADIHATILSIFLGGISVYAFNLYNTIDQMEIQAFREADKINIITPSCVGTLKIFKNYVASDAESRVQLVMKLAGFIGSDHRELPENLLEQGREIISMMTILSRHYPLGGETIQFSNVDKLQQWIFDIEYIARHLLGALDFSRFRMYEALKVHDDFIDACFVQLGTPGYYEKISPTGEKTYIKRELTKDEVEDSNRACCTKIGIADNFAKDLTQAQNIARSTNMLLKDIQSYKNRHLSKTTIIWGYLFTVIAFVFGVVYPIIGSDRRFETLMPLLLYFMIFLFLLIEILKI